MSDDMKKLIQVIIRGMKFTIGLLEKLSKGEPV
jgi:hypothetical protein